MEFVYEAGKLSFKLDSVLIVVAVVLVLIVVYRRQLDGYLRRLTKFSAGGITVELAQAAQQMMREALELARQHPNWRRQVEPILEQTVITRAGERLEVLRGAVVLWVDDHPEYTLSERRMLHRLGLFIDPVTDTDAAIRRLAGGSAGYDLILSDIARGDDPTAGLSMLRRLREDGISVPLVFYAGTPAPGKGTPPGAFGVATQPAELLHLVIDALERRPRPAAWSGA
ncbi:CheY-like chemotaxis protein [Plasticicumulans lactativorans]|uniref:CheY-like chemotaxis protein n=1 Tax=Plasticicumulans lactativorans TaxID=1133106 RepID=A0A4R2L4U1_9GAMM|nr:response regulator [Plasticicumulans lactativorans]TCO80782.1 CheY-like chemotaxis protein [Plasticicumulans lactativorans]